MPKEVQLIDASCNRTNTGGTSTDQLCLMLRSVTLGETKTITIEHLEPWAKERKAARDINGHYNGNHMHISISTLPK